MDIQNNKNLVGRFFKALGIGLRKHPIYSLFVEPTVLMGAIEIAHEPLKAAIAFGAFIVGNVAIASSGYKELQGRELHQELSRNGMLNRTGTIEIL